MSSRRGQSLKMFFGNDEDAADSIGSNDSDSEEEDGSLGSSLIGAGSGHTTGSSHGKMDSEMMEKLGQSWREEIDDTVQHRLSLC